MDATTHRRPATGRPPLLEGDHRETEEVARDRKTGARRQRGVMTPRLGAPAVPFQRESSHAFGAASHGALTILHGVKALMLVYAGLLSAAVTFATNWPALIPWRPVELKSAKKDWPCTQH